MKSPLSSLSFSTAVKRDMGASLASNLTSEQIEKLSQSFPGSRSVAGIPGISDEDDFDPKVWTKLGGKQHLVFPGGATVVIAYLDE
jgi:hypothetical protein